MVNPRFVIKAVLSGQRLNINVPLTVAGTVNYIGVEAKCTSEWDDCTVVCYLYQAGTGYTAQLGLIYDAERKLYYYPNAERLTLTAGEWAVWFVGVMAESGQETYKVTSETRVFTVYEYPFASSIPPGDITLDEEAIARATDAQNKANLLLDKYNAGDLTGPKGDPGDPAEIGFVQVSVDNTTGTPRCEVSVTENPENTYNMQFAFSGIKGAKGDTGDRGPKGDPGSQGTPGRDGTNGRDGVDGQTIDDYVLVQAEQPTSETNKMWLKPATITPPDMIPTVEEVKRDYAPIIIEYASGTIAYLQDGADNLPIRKLTVNIVPSQSGSGAPSGSNIRPLSGWTACNGEITGKNRLSKDGIYQGSIGADGTANTSDTTRCFSMFIKIAPGSTYTFSCGSGIVIRAVHTYKRRAQTGNSWNGRILNATNSITFTAGSDDNYCRVMFCKTNYNERIRPSDITYPQMENGSIATPYEAYSGEAIAVQFPSEAGSVYSGTMTINDDGTGTLKARPYYASYSGETLVGPWISDRDVYVAGTTPTAGAQVVDMGGTETVYHITADQVKTLLGTNNICVYCGNIYIEYGADTKLYIQKINTPSDNDMIADTQIASGKYFIIGNNLYLSTTTIPAGDTIVPGTNCTKTNLAEALNTLNV